MKLRPKSKPINMPTPQEYQEFLSVQPPIPYTAPRRDPLADLLAELDTDTPDEGPGLASAEWGDPRSLRPSEKAMGLIYLGNEDADSHRCLGLCNDSHVLVSGGTRSGKGVSFITSNLLLWEGSAIVNDPKGENATVTARRRGNGSAFAKGLGQKVHILDPFGLAGRPDDPLTDLQAQFNPLKGLNPEDPNVIDLVNEIVSSMIIVSKESDSRLWTQPARSLLKATILHVISSPDFEEDERNLVTVYDLLCHGDREKKEFLDQIGADEVPPAHLLLYRAMEKNPAFNGIIETAGETYKNLLTQAPKQYLGVIETLKADLEFMDSPGIQECLMGSDFTLDDLKNDPKGVTIYLCLPLSLLETHFRWLRVVITQAMNTMERQKFRPKSGWPVLFMLDEFAALQKMPSLQNGIAQMAGHGLKFVLIVQDYIQLKSVYGDAWETFVSNCAVKLFLSTKDHFTRDYASKLVGTAELAVKSHNSNAGLNVSRMSGRNRSESTGRTIGTGSSHGHTYGRGSGAGPGLFAFSSSRNWSRTHSSSLNESETFTKTQGTSSSTTNGENRTVGMQVNWQTRPLIRPEEVGRLFAYREEPGGVPFAGDILVLVAGEHAISIRRTLYYRHICFEGLFDPHPEFPVEPAYRAPEIIEAIPLPSDPPPTPTVIPIPPTPEPHLSLWERFKRWLLAELAETWRVGTQALFSEWGLALFWAPLSGLCLLFWLFYFTGVLEDVFLLIIASVLHLFPSLLGT